MARLNLFLLFAVVFCALGVVTSQHEARRLFKMLDADLERAEQLEIEYGQLQLELSTWATQPRIEKLARERLHMSLPDGAHIVTMPLKGGGQ